MLDSNAPRHRKDLDESFRTVVVRPSHDEVRPQFLHVKVPVHGRFISDLVPVHGRFSSHPVRFTTSSVHIQFLLTTGSGSHVLVRPVPVRFTAMLILLIY